MSDEDNGYKVLVDGKYVNISKVIKSKKVDYGEIKFYKLKQRFPIDVINERNNIIMFSVYGNIYYYGVVKGVIRRKGEKEWHSKLITVLKKDIDNIIKDKDINELENNRNSNKYNPDLMKAPGKYKDKTWSKVSIIDPNYVNWMISETKDINLKNMLINLMKSST